MNLPSVAIVGVLVVGNDGSVVTLCGEDDDNASVVEGVIGDIGSSGRVETTTEITNKVNDISISKDVNEASYQHR